MIRVREVIGPNQDQPESEVRAGRIGTAGVGGMGTMTASITKGIMSQGRKRITIVTSERTGRRGGKIPNSTSSTRNAGLRTRMKSTIVKNMIRGSRTQEGKINDTIVLTTGSMKEGMLKMIGRI